MTAVLPTTATLPAASIDTVTTPARWVRAGAILPTLLPTVANLMDSPTSAPVAAACASPPYAAPDRCPECDGVGFFATDVPYGHPRFGVLIPCRCTQAKRHAREVAQITRMSNLAAFRDQTFAQFNPDVPGVRKAYLRALDFAQHLRGWLVLFGGCGVGKTHLAAAVANLALDRGEQVLFAVVPDLLDHLRATFGPSSEVGYDERFELVRSIPLLVLDDLGTESATAWAREKLYQIINHRYNLVLPTIITSNRPADSLDLRVRSRMYQRAIGGELLHITANDYRKRSEGGN